MVFGFFFCSYKENTKKKRKNELICDLYLCCQTIIYHLKTFKLQSITSNKNINIQTNKYTTTYNKVTGNEKGTLYQNFKQLKFYINGQNIFLIYKIVYNNVDFFKYLKFITFISLFI